MKISIRLLMALMMVVLMTAAMGCGGKSVSRVEASETIDLSGRWNDSDSRLVSDEMIQDVLMSPWLMKFMSSHGGKTPVVIVGAVRNRSDEHINVRTFIKDLERALINSGEVEFVASSGEREDIRQERLDQARQASEDTAKEHGMESGADFMLIGSLNSIQDREGGKTVKFYQVNLELVDLQSNRKVWVGQKEIKKLIERSRFKF